MVISVGVEGKKFSKRRRHDVVILIFWLRALEFKILEFLFFCCLYIFLCNFARFSVHKSLKNLGEINRELFRRIYKLSQNKPNEFSSTFNLADLVPSVHLQFANLLEKQTSKRYILFINPGKCYLPCLKRRNDTTKNVCSTDL